MDDLASARRAAARAFIGEGLPKGKTWAALPYAYDYDVEDDMRYLAWQDVDPKKPDDRKVAEATQRYVEKFGAEPTEVIRKAPGLWWLGPIPTE